MCTCVYTIYTHTHTSACSLSYLHLARCVVFYLPYAYYVTAFTYANGDAPSPVANIVFTLLVVGGNQMMYFAADAVSIWCDFGFEDDREYWYNVS